MNADGFCYFTLTDRTGQAHNYDVILHDGMSGWDLYTKIAAIIAPIAGSGLLAVLASKKGSAMDVDVEALAANEGIGSSLRSVIVGFDPRVVQSLFQHVTRDGVKLNDPAARGQAYRANYDEQALAMLKVMTINGFFPAASEIERLAVAAKKLVDAAGKSSGTPPPAA